MGYREGAAAVLRRRCRNAALHCVAKKMSVLTANGAETFPLVPTKPLLCNSQSSADFPGLRSSKDNGPSIGWRRTKTGSLQRCKKSLLEVSSS